MPVPESVTLRPRHPIDKAYQPAVWAHLVVKSFSRAVPYQFDLTFDQVVALMLDIKSISMTTEEVKRAWVLMDAHVKEQEKELP